MRVVRWTEPDGRSRRGAIDGDKVRVLEGDWGDFQWGDEVVPLEGLTLNHPVTPRNIVCVGLNYRLHALESGYPVPTTPPLFTKLTTSLIDPGQPIVHPRLTNELDYEAELGVVIGRTAKSVSVADAIDHVAGYICVNDVSARDLQKDEGFGWVRGKSADTFCPVGSFVVTADEIPDPQGLGVRCYVNGELRQDSTTADMVFSVAEIISYVSQALTLYPGDLICTGTPSGVASGMDDPQFLVPGDTVLVEIDHLGSIENLVVGSAS